MSNIKSKQKFERNRYETRADSLHLNQMFYIFVFDGNDLMSYIGVNKKISFD